MQARKTYKHINCLDTAIEVQRILGVCEDGTLSVLVSWWNIRAKIPRKIVRYQAVNIRKEEIDNWKEWHRAA